MIDKKPGIPLIDYAMRLDHRLTAIFPPSNNLDVKWHLEGNEDFFNEKNLNTIRFLTNNMAEPAPFIDFLFSPEFNRVFDFASRFHKEDRRKVTEDPYLKHLFYTGYLVFNSEFFRGLEPSDKRIFAGAAFLHDSIELYKKTHQEFTAIDFFGFLLREGFDYGEARKMTVIASLLTPPQKNESIKKDEQKLRNFKTLNITEIFSMTAVDVRERDWGIFVNPNLPDSEFPFFETAEYRSMLRMVKEIKSADVAANVRETVDDLEQGKDGKDNLPNGMTPLQWRFEHFKVGYLFIKQYHPEHPLLKQMTEDMDTIFAYLKSRESPA